MDSIIAKTSNHYFQTALFNSRNLRLNKLLLIRNDGTQKYQDWAGMEMELKFNSSFL